MEHGSPSSFTYDPVWSHVSENIPPSERQELRRVLGPQQLDSNDDLLQELKTLYSILDEFADETDRSAEEQKQKRQILTHMSATDTLVQRQLVMIGRDWVDGTGVSLTSSSSIANAVPKLEEREVEILRFVLGMQTGPQRPQSRSSDGAMASARGLGSVASRHLMRMARTDWKILALDLQASILNESVANTGKDARTAQAIETITKLLESENRYLLQGVEQARACIDDEVDYNTFCLRFCEPSVMEMRRLAQKLEKSRSQWDPDNSHVRLLSSLPPLSGGGARPPSAGGSSRPIEAERPPLGPPRPPSSGRSRTGSVHRFRREVMSNRP